MLWPAKEAEDETEETEEKYSVPCSSIALHTTDSPTEHLCVTELEMLRPRHQHHLLRDQHHQLSVHHPDGPAACVEAPPLVEGQSLVLQKAWPAQERVVVTLAWYQRRTLCVSRNGGASQPQWWRCTVGCLAYTPDRSHAHVASKSA